jgi:CRISPR-associated endonuclease/helicase Cas3
MNEPLPREAEYVQFFRVANGKTDDNNFRPYPYQVRLALGDPLPQLIDVPTGLGKTAAVILAWLWRRRRAKPAIQNATPRRLIYCLPMRTLVEQTERAAKQWLKNLGLENEIAVHALMGGREAEAWDTEPQRDAILIGTQDMLLSRALNRGYAMSRYRWPIHFALLNNDCLWLIDETQLMGVGLTTTAQMQGLRAKLGAYGAAQTLWMSATLDPSQLTTFDHRPANGGFAVYGLTEADYDNAYVVRLIEARKPLQPAAVSLTSDTDKDYSKTLAKTILAGHEPGTLTLVVLNRVARAQAVFSDLEEATAQNNNRPDVKLIHSRFRPIDRSHHQAEALDDANLPPPGRIVVATQAIEAGVDISARTLFTELAPWPSLVQRFGRCNRRGEWGHSGKPDAAIFWIDIETGDGKRAKDMVLPYDADELAGAREHL